MYITKQPVSQKFVQSLHHINFVRSELSTFDVWFEIIHPPQSTAFAAPIQTYKNFNYVTNNSKLKLVQVAMIPYIINILFLVHKSPFNFSTYQNEQE